jgi:hypothetical protein
MDATTITPTPSSPTTAGGLFNWAVPNQNQAGMWSGFVPPGLYQPRGLFGNGSIVDKIPADMLYLVDPHWNQFPPLEPLMYTLLGVFVILAGIVAVVGNFVVMYMSVLVAGH